MRVESISPASFAVIGQKMKRIAAGKGHHRALRIHTRSGTEQAGIVDVEIGNAMNAPEGIGGADVFILPHGTGTEKMNRHEIGSRRIERCGNLLEIVSRLNHGPAGKSWVDCFSARSQEQFA